MGYFDFLIDRDRNTNPKEGMVYIYLLDCAWLKGELGDVPVKKHSIATNVVRLENGSYEFKMNGREYRCNYSWAFAENTPENLKALIIYETHKRSLELQQKIVDEKWKLVKTLQIKEDEDTTGGLSEEV